MFTCSSILSCWCFFTLSAELTLAPWRSSALTTSACPRPAAQMIGVTPCCWEKNTLGWNKSTDWKKKQSAIDPFLNILKRRGTSIDIKTMAAKEGRIIESFQAIQNWGYCRLWERNILIKEQLNWNNQNFISTSTHLCKWNCLQITSSYVYKNIKVFLWSYIHWNCLNWTRKSSF